MVCVDSTNDGLYYKLYNNWGSVDETIVLKCNDPAISRAVGIEITDLTLCKKGHEKLKIIEDSEYIDGSIKDY